MTERWLGGTERERGEKENRKREGKRNASECRGRGIQAVVVVVLTYFTVRRAPRVLEFYDALSTRCLPTVIPARCHVAANAEHGIVRNCYHGRRSAAGELGEARD